MARSARCCRHRDLRTTAIYAKADPAALALLVRPWPGVPAGSAAWPRPGSGGLAEDAT